MASFRRPPSASVQFVRPAGEGDAPANLTSLSSMEKIPLLVKGLAPWSRVLVGNSDVTTSGLSAADLQTLRMVTGNASLQNGWNGSDWLIGVDRRLMAGVGAIDANGFTVLPSVTTVSRDGQRRNIHVASGSVFPEAIAALSQPASARRRGRVMAAGTPEDRILERTPEDRNLDQGLGIIYQMPPDGMILFRDIRIFGILTDRGISGRDDVRDHFEYGGGFGLNRGAAGNGILRGFPGWDLMYVNYYFEIPIFSNEAPDLQAIPASIATQWSSGVSDSTTRFYVPRAVDIFRVDEGSTTSIPLNLVQVPGGIGLIAWGDARYVPSSGRVRSVAFTGVPENTSVKIDGRAIANDSAPVFEGMDGVRSRPAGSIVVAVPSRNTPITIRIEYPWAYNATDTSREIVLEPVRDGYDFTSYEVIAANQPASANDPNSTPGGLRRVLLSGYQNGDIIFADGSDYTRVIPPFGQRGAVAPGKWAFGVPATATSIVVRTAAGDVTIPLPDYVERQEARVSLTRPQTNNVTGPLFTVETRTLTITNVPTGTLVYVDSIDVTGSATRNGTTLTVPVLNDSPSVSLQYPNGTFRNNIPIPSGSTPTVNGAPASRQNSQLAEFNRETIGGGAQTSMRRAILVGLPGYSSVMSVTPGGEVNSILTPPPPPATLGWVPGSQPPTWECGVPTNATAIKITYPASYNNEERIFNIQTGSTPLRLDVTPPYRKVSLRNFPANTGISIGSRSLLNTPAPDGATGGQEGRWVFGLPAVATDFMLTYEDGTERTVRVTPGESSLTIDAAQPRQSGGGQGGGGSGGSGGGTGGGSGGGSGGQGGPPAPTTKTILIINFPEGTTVKTLPSGGTITPTAGSVPTERTANVPVADNAIQVRYPTGQTRTLQIGSDARADATPYLYRRVAAYIDSELENRLAGPVEFYRGELQLTPITRDEYTANAGVASIPGPAFGNAQRRRKVADVYLKVPYDGNSLPAITTRYRIATPEGELVFVTQPITLTRPPTAEAGAEPPAQDIVPSIRDYSSEILEFVDSSRTWVGNTLPAPGGSGSSLLLWTLAIGGALGIGYVATKKSGSKLGLWGSKPGNEKKS